MRKKILTCLAILVSVSIVITACGPSAPAVSPPSTEEMAQPTTPPEEPVGEETPMEEPEAEEPVVLRVGAMYPQDCWNPFSCTGVWYFSHLVIEGFADHYTTSEGCKGVPRLAESWEVSEDGRTWTIKLHDGITFSDGTPFTAETAKWNLDWYSQTPSLQEWFAETLAMESVEVVDELTLRYTTTDPIINSPDYDWVWWYMLNPNIWADIPEDELYTYEDFPPVGTGPYTVTEHVPGEYIIFDDRPDYYRGDPPIDRVIYTLYSNPDAIVSALLSGEIDITTPWLPPEAYDPLAGAPNVTIEEKEPYAGQLYWLIFNVFDAEDLPRNPAVVDPKVREAIDYAIDKQQLVDVALLGHGVTLPTAWAGVTDIEVAPDLEVTPYDPAMANQILDDAGYVDSDSDGVRENPDGTPLELNLVYGLEFPPSATMSNMIKDWLGQVGISVLPEAQELGSWNSIVLDQHSFDMAINAATHDIDAASMDFWFSCWSAESGSNALNYPGYCNPEMDDLVYEYWYSDDPEGRWEPMYEAQRILADDRPIITLAGQNTIQAFRNDRYEFPFDTCDVAFNMFDPEGLLQATVK
jgi:peptide/nickel transport system substrate-binding protein